MYICVYICVCTRPVSLFLYIFRSLYCPVSSNLLFLKKSRFLLLSTYMYTSLYLSLSLSRHLFLSTSPALSGTLCMTPVALSLFRSRPPPLLCPYLSRALSARGRWQPIRTAQASGLISQKMFLKSFCRSQLPHKSVNVCLTFTYMKNKRADLCGNRLLQNDLTKAFCEVRPRPNQTRLVFGRVTTTRSHTILSSSG